MGDPPFVATAQVLVRLGEVASYGRRALAERGRDLVDAPLEAVPEQEQRARLGLEPLEQPVERGHAMPVVRRLRLSDGHPFDSLRSLRARSGLVPGALPPAPAPDDVARGVARDTE